MIAGSVNVCAFTVCRFSARAAKLVITAGLCIHLVNMLTVVQSTSEDSQKVESTYWVDLKFSSKQLPVIGNKAHRLSSGSGYTSLEYRSSGKGGIDAMSS